MILTSHSDLNCQVAAIDAAVECVPGQRRHTPGYRQARESRARSELRIRAPQGLPGHPNQ